LSENFEAIALLFFELLFSVKHPAYHLQGRILRYRYVRTVLRTCIRGVLFGNRFRTANNKISCA